MHKWGEVGFSILLVVVFGYMFAESTTLSPRARTFPLAITAPMLVLALFNLARVGLAAYRNAPEPETETLPPGEEPKGAEQIQALASAATPDIPADVARARLLNILLWIGGSFLIMWLLGFREGLPIFVFLYLFFESKDRLWFAVLMGAAAWVALHFFFGGFLHYPWPAPQISIWLNFDWPAI